LLSTCLLEGWFSKAEVKKPHPIQFQKQKSRQRYKIVPKQFLGFEARPPHDDLSMDSLPRLNS